MTTTIEERLAKHHSVFGDDLSKDALEKINKQARDIEGLSFKLAMTKETYEGVLMEIKHNDERKYRNYASDEEFSRLQLELPLELPNNQRKVLWEEIHKANGETINRISTYEGLRTNPFSFGSNRNQSVSNAKLQDANPLQGYSQTNP